MTGAVNSEEEEEEDIGSEEEEDDFVPSPYSRDSIEYTLESSRKSSRTQIWKGDMY